MKNNLKRARLYLKTAIDLFKENPSAGAFAGLSAAMLAYQALTKTPTMSHAEAAELLDKAGSRITLTIEARGGGTFI